MTLLSIWKQHACSDNGVHTLLLKKNEEGVIPVNVIFRMKMWRKGWLWVAELLLYLVVYHARPKHAEPSGSAIYFFPPFLASFLSTLAGSAFFGSGFSPPLGRGMLLLKVVLFAEGL